MSQLPCAYCDAPIPLSEAERTSLCPVCSRPLTVCGRYRLKELLSQSDADRVYTAISDADKKEVAVKVVLAREDDWAAISEFERIARTLQSLKSKTVPQILAWEKGGQGRLILVREKCQGHSLEARLSSGQRPPATALRMMLDDLLSLLVDLHGKSPPLLHRDIRAGNILFRDPSWNPVLADFKPNGDGSMAQDLLALGKTFEAAGGSGMPVVAGLCAQKYISARYALTALREEAPPVATPAVRQTAAPSSAPQRTRSAARNFMLVIVGLSMVSGFIRGIVGKNHGRNQSSSSSSNEDSAVQRYRQQCDRNQAMGCYNLGYRYESGKGIAKNEFRAAALYEKACNLGEYMGCNNLGVFYETGRGVVKDVPRAATLYQKACDGKDWLACRNLGYMYSNGVGVEKDPPRAAALYQKACDHDDIKGCFNLGVLYENGKGVAEDYARALTLYQKACNAQDWEGCTNAGWMYASGHAGAAADDVQARTLYQKGCDHGDARGCNNLGILYEHGRKVDIDVPRAFALYKKACDADDSYGCVNLGYFYESGKATTKDLDQSARLYQKGCKLGYDKGCNYFLDMCKDAKTKRTGLMLLQQACEGGDAWSCDELKKLG
jgi:uncharacterized protein